MAGEWVRDSKGRLRRATISHMGRRLPGFDYRRAGCYVVTIVLADRSSAALGALEVRRRGASGDGGWVGLAEALALGLSPDEIEARVVFSALGRAIFAHFRRMGDFTRRLRPVYCAVMPDHLHLLVEVVGELERPLGNAIGGFKTGCEKIYAGMGGKGRLFAEGFVDAIILRAGQLASEFSYLLDNPRRLAVKRLWPELFKVSREIRVTFRLAPKGPDGPLAPGQSASPLAPGQSPRPLAPGQASSPLAPGQAASPLAPGQSPSPLVPGQSPAGAVRPAPAAPAVGRFAAIGNHFLLDAPAFRQIQVSRRHFAYARDEKGRPAKDRPPVVATPEFARALADALSAARQGVVLVSPCISQGEREIARQVFAAGGRVITLANKGFSPLYKPGGKLFEACANGNLLMLAPVGWPYQPAQEPMTRADALVLNRIAQLIAGEGAATIDYKGASMVGVDEAVAAVL